MPDDEVHYFPVPDGFPAMSLPVIAESRLAASDIELGFWEEKDVMRMAELNYDGFPMVWWNKHEDEKLPMNERVRRLALRSFAPAVNQQGLQCINATVKATGEIVGMAVWYFCTQPGSGPTSYFDIPGATFPTTFLPFVYRTSNPQTLGWAQKMGWTEAMQHELFSHVRPSFNEEMTGYDLRRLKEMGDRPHIYLGPICVSKKYRRRGVGGLLIQWGLDKADEYKPPLPVVLDAFPNARPVYRHFGFEPTPNAGEPGKESLLIREPR